MFGIDLVCLLNTIIVGLRRGGESLVVDDYKQFKTILMDCYLHLDIRKLKNFTKKDDFSVPKYYEKLEMNCNQTINAPQGM